MKDMRLAIALLGTGVHRAQQARNRRICATAARIGSHPPSSTTCGLVRFLIRDAHRVGRPAVRTGPPVVT
ncbi:hypothetical protein [Streptomyces sp. Ncost-T10-10d]|uniref:hypothetical protein n=1 Tax=Streptomyces sp. Ncost-T10-10d TaxID=1839774 RepID=UPI0035210DE3